MTSSAQVRSRLHAQTTQLWSPPGVIDLGIGQPQDAILPLEVMSEAMARAAVHPRRHPLQYGIERGDGYLRAALSDFLADQYASTPVGEQAVDPDLMFVTNGNSQALDLCCATFTTPGDVVFVEEPTYFLALDIFRNHGLRVVGIAMDDEGLRIDALEEALRHDRPAFLYTIPSAHNPTGATLSAGRRTRLVDLARENEFLVVADEVYHLLRHDGAPPTPMAELLGSGVVLCLNTFSKILAPGLRLGWIQAGEPLIARLEGRGYLVSGGGLNPFTAALVADVLDDGSAADYLAGLRRLFAERIDVMDSALRTHLPVAGYARPTGGYFFWLHFPEGSPVTDTASVRARARELGVGFQPGQAFSTKAGLRDRLRLSFAYYDSDDLRRGVELLGRAFSEGPSEPARSRAPSST